MSAVSRRNTVFSPMKDFGSLFQPNVILGQFLYGSENQIGE